MTVLTVNLANLQPLYITHQNLCKKLNLSLTFLNQKQKNYFTQDICFLLRSNINGSKSVSSNKEKSHVSVHDDTFNSFGGFNRSDSSVVFNSSGGFNSSAGGGFAGADVGTTGSTRDFSGGNVGSEDNVLTPQLPRHTGRVRQAPTRYGEWVNTQQVLNPETDLVCLGICISFHKYQRRMSLIGRIYSNMIFMHMICSPKYIEMHIYIIFSPA